MKPKFLTLIFLVCGLLMVFSLFAAVPPVPDQPANYVVDLAGIIDPQTEANLNRRLKELEDRTTAQMVVLTINSLEGEPIEKFSLKTAQKWALGQKGKDNGVLITVAVQDRKYRIEVGYGLEAVLPDSLVGSIGRECFVANFRKGKYSEGLSEAVSQIAGKIIGDEGGKTAIDYKKQESYRRIKTEAKKFILRTLKDDPRELLGWLLLLSFFFVFPIVLILLGLAGKLPRYYTRDEPDESKDEDGDYHGSWFSGFGGGGFSGGFGGGFGGGGGGFGGGGVSGGW